MGVVGEMSEFKGRTIIDDSGRCFRFPICCSVSTPEHVKGDCHYASRATQKY